MCGPPVVGLLNPFVIGVIHTSSWLETDAPLRLPTGTEAFEHPVLTTAAQFTEEPIDHIAAPHGFEFSAVSG